MLDSVRVRLTVWYSIVLGIVLILLAVLTYASISEILFNAQMQIMRSWPMRLRLRSRANCRITPEPDGVKEAARESMMEHRFRDTIFVVLDPTGHPLISSLELPGAGPHHEHISDAFFFTGISAATTNPNPDGTLNQRHSRRQGGLPGFTLPLTANGKTYTLVLLSPCIR